MTNQQLNEVEFLEWLKKSDKHISTFNDALDTNISEYKVSNSVPYGETLTLSKKLGKVAQGTLYMGRGRYFTKNVPLLIGVDNDGIVSVIVELVKYGEKSYKVDLTIARDNNTFPAHKVYAGFVKLGFILVSGAQQSAGGHMIWRRLAKEPGVVVHGWDTLNKKPVNLGDDIEDESLTHASSAEINGRILGLKGKMKDKTLDPMQKQKIKKDYEDEIADLKFVKNKIVMVASAKKK